MNNNLLEDFIINSNQDFYNLMVDFIDEEIFFSDFGLSKINKSTFLELLSQKSSKLNTELKSYFEEITEASTPIFSITCNFQSYSGIYELYIYKLLNKYVIISKNSEESNIEVFNHLPIKMSKIKMLSAIEYVKLEIENYRDNKEYFGDEFSLELEWNFNLPEFLFNQSLITNKTLQSIIEINKSFR